MSFPYIKALTINDCYAYQNLQVVADPDGLAFKHIILTGKNGSGKSTILRAIDLNLQTIRKYKTKLSRLNNLGSWISQSPGHTSQSSWLDEKFKLLQVEIDYSEDQSFFFESKPNYVLNFFNSKRGILNEKVKTVTENSEFDKVLNGDENVNLSLKLKQYLVNKKVSQAFDVIEGKNIIDNAGFFLKLEQIFQNLFADGSLRLIFFREEFDFALQGKVGEIRLEHLSDGFSSVISIILDLLVRIDLIRSRIGNYSYDVPGILLIDEPENHLHIKLQYSILPLISAFFPRLQIIAATHSPAVISSLENAVVYDISTQKTISDWPIGSSFSELMLRHFGLENEYGPVADKIIDDVKSAVREKDRDKLFSIFTENVKYLEGNTLKIEIENKLIQMEAGKLVK